MRGIDRQRELLLLRSVTELRVDSMSVMLNIANFVVLKDQSDCLRFQSVIESIVQRIPKFSVNLT